MATWPATRITLLDRMRDQQDQAAWTEFVALYGPLVFRFARKRLPQDEDADVLQEVLKAVLHGSFDHSKGRFHKWLLTVTLNQIRDFFAKRRRPGQAEAYVDFQRRVEEEPAKVENEWDHEHRQRLFERATDLVRPESNPLHWQAFVAGMIRLWGSVDMPAMTQTIDHLGHGVLASVK